MQDVTVTFTGNDANATGLNLTVIVKDKNGNKIVDYTKELDVSLSGTISKKLDFKDVIISQTNSPYTYTIKLEYTGATAGTTKITSKSVTFTSSAISSYSMIWSDKAADNVDTTTKDRFTEANIPGVPAASQTLSK